MSLVALKVVVAGEQQVAFAFDAMGRDMRDLTVPLTGVGDVILEAVRGQFVSQGSRGRAGRWAPLSPAYAAWKHARFPGRPILVRTGVSRDAALDAPRALRVTGSRLVYEPPGRAADILGYHQTGAGDLPVRRVLDLVPGDGRMMQRVFAHWLQGQSRLHGLS